MLREFLFKSVKIINMNYSFASNKANRLYILMFHQVNDDDNAFYPAVPVKVFEQICNFISKRFDTIYFSDVETFFKKNKKPGFILSFDDGHYDILQNAYPILRKYNMKFNMNVVTESIETGRPQDNVRVYHALNITQEKDYSNNDILPYPIKIKIDKNNTVKTEIEFVRLFQRLNKLERRLVADDIVERLAGAPTNFSKMLSKEDIGYLYENGAEVGSHTHSHPMLSNITDSEIEFELVHSKKILKDLCGIDICLIAFPDGKYNKKVIKKSLEAGYKYLLLTDDMVNIIDGKRRNAFYRIGLYHKSLDENLAKIFGFHRAIHDLKSRIGNA